MLFAISGCLLQRRLNDFPNILDRNAVVQRALNRRNDFRTDSLMINRLHLNHRADMRFGDHQRLLLQPLVRTAHGIHTDSKILRKVSNRGQLLCPPNFSRKDTPSNIIDKLLYIRRFIILSDRPCLRIIVHHCVLQGTE